MTGFWQSFAAKAAWKTSDQRFASARPDVLTYVTEPLANDVVLAGATEVELFVSSTGTDADFVVKLIDVHPEQDEKSPEEKPLPGYQMLLTHEVFPTRFRNSFEKGEPLPPNQPVRLKFQLGDRLHRFRRGHKIMVQIQSSMFPLFATNPQQFVKTYEEANKSLYTVADHSIYRSAKRPTSITLPVLGEEEYRKH